MIFSKFLVMKRYFSLLFLSACSLFGMGFDNSTINVVDNSYDRTSNISVVPINYDVEYVYNDSVSYGVENVISRGVMGYAISDSDRLVVAPINEVIEVGRGYDSISYGSTTGYGANCVGCSGNVACSTSYGTHNLISDGIYYNDSTFGNVRIIAASFSKFSCGSIIEIDNGIMEPFMGIVLDTGGAMRDEWNNGNVLVDIAFSSEDSSEINSATNRSGNVKFKVYRNGW